MLQIIVYLQGKKNPYEGYNGKDIPEDHTEPVNPAKDEIVVHEVDNPIFSFRHIKKDDEGKRGQ